MCGFAHFYELWAGERLSSSFRKLRTAILGAVWSCLQPLANTGAVLGLLDGPAGCDPVFCFVWYWFRMFRMYLAYRPGRFIGCTG